MSILVVSDSMDSMSSDEEPEPTEKLLLRGPQNRGRTEFDKQCMFGNDMYLREDHVSFLLDWCDPKFPPQIKYYVYKMIHSSVMRDRCKLKFGAEFTDRYLKNRLDEPVDVHVSHMTSKKPRMVRMKMGAGSNNAILTTGWAKVVRRFKLKQDDIVLFCFHERDDGLHNFVEVLYDDQES